MNKYLLTINEQSEMKPFVYLWQNNIFYVIAIPVLSLKYVIVKAIDNRTIHRIEELSAAIFCWPE